MKTDKKFAAEGGKRAERPQLDAQNMRRSSAESRQRKRKPFARSDATIFFSYHSLTACTSLFRTAGSIHSPSIEQFASDHQHQRAERNFHPRAIAASRPAGHALACVQCSRTRECFACRDDARSKERNTTRRARARNRSVSLKFDRAIFESNHLFEYEYAMHTRTCSDVTVGIPSCIPSHHWGISLMTILS